MTNLSAEELGFTIEDRGVCRVLVWSGDNGCRPATDEECAMWDALARHPQPECGEVFDAEAIHFQWVNGEIEAGTVIRALYAARRLLAERDARIEALTEYAAVVERSADKAEQERDQLRARVADLAELLGKLRAMVCATPENDIDRMPVWISTKHPVIERIDASLNPPQANSQEQTP